MARYTKNHCPVCEQAFTDADDIVVCPECGTPYHRECWKKVGACIHEAEHAAGFEWKPDAEPADEAAAARHLAVCPNCGNHNEPGAVKCSHCGVPLNAAPRSEPPQNAPIYARGTMDTPDITRVELKPTDCIDGIQAQDWATYTGHSALYYLMQFFRMEKTGKKITLCFSAFLLGPIYFFYRKMWKQGILMALVQLLLYTPLALLVLQQYNPAVLGGVLAGAAWLETAVLVCDILWCAYKVFMGLSAVAWYQKTAKRNIEAICARCPDEPTRSRELAQHGGTSILLVVLYFGVSALLTVGFMYLAGPAFVRYVFATYGVSL